jgi:hypothetical protein
MSLWSFRGQWHRHISSDVSGKKIKQIRVYSITWQELKDQSDSLE